MWALARATKPVTGRRWTRALYETMSALHAPQRLAGWIDAARRAARHEAAETHQQVWSVVCDVLSDADAALAETPLSAAEFFDLLRAALAEESLGLTPPALDQVLVGSIERSRHPDIRYAWIVALNDGVFPATPSEDALLSTEERAALTSAGLPAPRAQRDDAFDERLLAYIALTRPSDGLVLSYALCDGRGAELAASPLVDWVRSTLPELKVDVADDTAPPVCMSEFVRGYLNARRAPAFAPERRRYAALRRRISSDVTIRRRLATALRGLHYANRTRAVPGYRRSNETPDRVLWFGSPSEMETYLQCPFKHYVRYGLRVRERPAPRPLHLELGEAAHQVLRAVFERAIDDQRRARDLTDEDWLGWLEEVRAAYEAGERSAVEDCRPEVTFLRGVLFERLRDLLRAHAERYRRGRFEPLAVEQEFGPNDAAWPPLEVRVEDERVLWMGGKIDRVDQAIVAGRRLLVVYDYKSSLGRVSVDYLTGDRLQLFLYARVLDSASDAKAGGALLAPLYPSLANADKWRDCDEPIQTMGLFLPRGRFVSDLADAFDEQAPDGGSAVVHMRRKNDGEFYQHSDACSADDFAALLRLAERTVAGGAAGIASGDVSVAPLLEGRTLACRQCAYREVCRYEPVMNAVRPAARSLPLLDECVEDDTGDAGGEGRA
ncbi:MAG: hypothetical protein D6744_15220 [Planctomycetota bacterium]|nr:MAG: hypothetical protein D6744_15220 [Planctomycetota bacterium]